MVVNRGRAKGRNEEDGEKEREMKGDEGRESAGREKDQITVNTTINVR